MAYKTFPMLKLYFENHDALTVKLEVEKQTSANVAAAKRLRQTYDGHNERNIQFLAEQETRAFQRYEVVNKNINQLCDILYNKENECCLTLEEVEKIFKKYLHRETEMLLIHISQNWMIDCKFTLFQLMKANII